MARGVEDVDLIAIVVKFHDGGRNRDTSLFLDVHPVGCGRLPNFVVLHCSSHLYLSTEEKELFGQCGFTGIRVGDDGEGASAFYLVHSFRDFMLSMQVLRASIQ